MGDKNDDDEKKEQGLIKGKKQTKWKMIISVTDIHGANTKKEHKNQNACHTIVKQIYCKFQLFRGLFSQVAILFCSPPAHTYTPLFVLIRSNAKISEQNFVYRPKSVLAVTF